MKKILFILLICLPFYLYAQIITTVASSGVYDPNGLVFDANGNLFFTTLLGNQIKKIDTTGNVTTIAGTGSAGFYGDGGLATNANLNQPCGITVDTLGNLFFADIINQRIRKIDVSTGIISTIAGIGPGGYTTGGFSGDGGMASDAALFCPSGVCFDATGNLYIADCLNRRIRKINKLGVISTIAGNGIVGSSGDGGLATAAECSPNTITLDNFGNIYFTESGSVINRIRKINSLGLVYRIAGDSSYIYNGDDMPATNATLNPSFIAFDATGFLYVSDIYNNRVRRIGSDGIIHTIVGNGIGTHFGDGGLASASKIDQPGGIAFNYCGNLYIGEVGGPPYIRKVSFNPTCNLSVPEVKTENEVSIYPNPTHEEITISGVKTDVKWGLFNIKSIIEQQGILKRGSNTLSIEALSPGLYILELTMDDGTRIMKKIIKL